MDIEAIKKIIARWAESEPLIVKAYIYGSRAGENYQENSDLDIAIKIKKLPSDSNVLATWIFEKNRLERRLQRLLGPYNLHLELLDNEETPTIHDAVAEKSILVYAKTSK